MIDHRITNFARMLAPALLITACYEGGHPQFDINQYPELEEYRQKEQEILTSSSRRTRWWTRPTVCIASPSEWRWSR